MKPMDSSSWNHGHINLLDPGGPLGNHHHHHHHHESPEFEVATSVRGNVNLSAIDRIADGVERMIDAWDLENVQRGQEYADVFNSLAAATTHTDEIQQQPPAAVKMKVLPVATSQLMHQDKKMEEDHCNVHRSSPWSTHQEDPLVDKGKHRRNVMNPNHHHHHHHPPHCCMQSSHAIQCKVSEDDVRNHQARDQYHEKLNGRPVMKHHDFNNKYVHPLHAVYMNCNSSWLANNPDHHPHSNNTGPVIETKEFTDPGCPGVTFLQDRFTGATVLEIRRNYGGGCVRIQTSGTQSDGKFQSKGGYQTDMMRMSSGKSMDDTGSQIQLLVNAQSGQTPPTPPPPPPPPAARITPMEVPKMASRVGEHDLVQMSVAGHGKTTSMKEAEAEVGDNLNIVAKLLKYCFSHTSSQC